MAEFEFGGMTFKGGKAAVLLTALSTLGGASWAAFEFYKDYTDMKEVVQNIDTDAIAARNIQIEQKLDDAIEYTRDIKTGLRDDILAIEKQADRAEDKVRTMENEVREMKDKASERFETKRDQMREDSDQEMEDLEDRLEKKLQRALDNPLAD
jgi:Skp family chaperone for outer membrane proteins